MLGNFTFATAWNYMFDTRFAAHYLVYFTDVLVLAFSYIAGGYVIVKTVDAGVSATRGFYADYAGSSSYANNLAAWELGVLSLFMGWALADIILATVGFAYTWDLTDARLAGALEHTIGIETPVSWGRSIKIVTLCLIGGLVSLISGYSLGQVVDPLISYYG